VEATHDAIRDIMYALVQENGHVVWKKWWYVFTLRVSLKDDFYMTQEDHVFVADVVVIDPTRDMVALSVISRLANTITKLNVIAKICKYKGLHEGHHFISMAMEVHGSPRCNMDHFIRECARLFHDIDDREVIYPCLFAFNFSSNM
jgi:hypothetical protein